MQKTKQYLSNSLLSGWPNTGGGFELMHPSCIYRNCKVFPLPGRLFGSTSCLCATDWGSCKKEILSEDVFLSLGLLDQPAPSTWPCLVGSTYYYFIFVLNALAHFWSQEPSSLGSPSGLELYYLQNNSLEGHMLKLKLHYFGHPVVKSHLIWKDSEAGKDWGQEVKVVTKHKMVQLKGYEFEQTPRDSEGQGSLACCSP